MLRNTSTVIGLAVASLGFASLASAASTFYSNFTPKPASPFTGDVSASGGVIFDDVLVNNPGLSNADINSIKVGILRDPGAPATDIEFFVATTTTPGSLPAFPILDTPVTSLGTVSLGAYAGATAVVPVTLNLSSPVSVPMNLTDQLGFGEFAIGLKFTNPGTSLAGNSWTVALPDTLDANIDGAWDYDQNFNIALPYSLSFSGNPIYTTFMLELTGNVPEPTTLGALGLIGAALLRRSRN